MKIRITGAKKSTYWYAGKIGEVFEVTGRDRDGDHFVHYAGTEDAYCVKPEDCVVVTEDSAPITVLPDESLGGVEREYREVKRKAAVGERIKVTVSGSFGDGTHCAGDVKYVIFADRWDDGTGVSVDYVKRQATEWNEGTGINHDRYVVLEPTDVLRIDGGRFRMVDRKAAVGERVIVLRSRGRFYEGGNTAIVSSAFSDGPINADFSGNAYVYGDGVWYVGNDIGYRVLEPIDGVQTALAPLSTRPATDQIAENIATLTAKNAALEAQVQTLEDVVKRMGIDLRVAREDIELIEEGVAGDIKSLESRVKALEVGDEMLRDQPQKVADSITELLETPAPKTAQEIRDEIVERAKAEISRPQSGRKYEYEYGPYGVNAEFIVNREKRTVVCLLRGFEIPTVYSRGIAKCAPNDVFNAHIGRAIALRRALGLEVPAEYLSVPNPTEARVGDVVKATSPDAYLPGTSGPVVAMEAGGLLYRNPRGMRGDGTVWTFPHDVTIIDDSREDCVSSAQKGAAA